MTVGESTRKHAPMLTGMDSRIRGKTEGDGEGMDSRIRRPLHNY